MPRIIHGVENIKAQQKSNNEIKTFVLLAKEEVGLIMVDNPFYPRIIYNDYEAIEDVLGAIMKGREIFFRLLYHPKVNR
jgi:hypothetical protein